MRERSGTASGRSRRAGLGGETGGAVLNSIEIYQNGLWTAAGALMTPRKGHSATALSNGRILIAGGQADAKGAFVLTTCEIYDPVAGGVVIGSSTGTMMSTARSTAWALC